MNQRKNILLIIPNLDFGGAQETFSKLSVTLSKHHRVYNVVFNRDDMQNYKLGGELIDLNIPASKNLLDKIINFKRRINRVKRIKIAHKIHVSISFLEGADYVNILSKQKNEKVIASIRGSKYFDQNIRGILGLIRHHILIPVLYNRTDCVVSLNYGVCVELRSRYKIRVPIHVIYNGFDFDFIAEQSKIEILPEEEFIFSKPVIVSHGRLSFEKGYDFLIRIFAELKDRYSSRLLLIGNGKEKSNLKGLCEALNLSYVDFSNYKIQNAQEADVVFLGYKKNPFMYLRRSTVFVLPSRHEGFGNSMLEAMTCGLAVVAADCPYGPREILKPNDSINAFGLLLSPISNESDSIKAEWISALENLLVDSEKRLVYSAIGIDRAKYFSLNTMTDYWMKLIDC